MAIRGKVVLITGASAGIGLATAKRFASEGAKLALNMISDTARDELAADNIRVISVYPRTTATDFHVSALGLSLIHI